MKKILITLVVAMSTLAASASGWIGGEIGFWRNYDANRTYFEIAPTAGYDFSDKWAVGATVGYAHIYSSGAKANAFTISPYVRWSAVKFGPCTLFIDGGFDYAVSKIKGQDGSSDAFGIGLKPGVKVKLCDQLSFVAHAGFLGFRHNDGVVYYGNGDTGFGFQLSSADLSFGVSYDF